MDVTADSHRASARETAIYNVPAVRQGCGRSLDHRGYRGLRVSVFVHIGCFGCCREGH